MHNNTVIQSKSEKGNIFPTNWYSELEIGNEGFI